MRVIRPAACVLALLGVMTIPGPDQTVAAEEDTIVLKIGNITRADTADGIRIAKATNAPVSTLSGQIVGTGSLTSIEAHPALEFRPTWIRIASGSTTVFGGTLESANGEFRQSAGYELSSGATRPVAFWDLQALPASVGEYALFLRRHSATPRPESNLNHTFRFTQARVDRQVGTTGLTFRPGNQWDLAVGGGATLRAGDNPGASFADLINTAFMGSMSFLRLPDGLSGAVVTCVGSPPVCGLKGVGNYGGYYGTATSLSPAALGVIADAASETRVTHTDETASLGFFRCPPPGTPPPVLFTGGSRDKEGFTRLAWESVPCGDVTYIVEITFQDGTVRTYESDTSFLNDYTITGNFTTFALAGAVSFNVRAVKGTGQLVAGRSEQTTIRIF